jgi:DeoR/GlpR family transcriptional regulator of sugar metabolism
MEDAMKRDATVPAADVQRDALPAKVTTEQRRRLIKQLVNQEGGANTDELAARFDVSYMTIWRDITALEQNGQLQRVRGGAVSLEDEVHTEPAYLSKQPLHSQAKERIARYAARHFVEDDDILFLEAGTTVAAMTKYLHQGNLTVVTNGVETIYSTLPRLAELTVMSCGGILRDKAHTFVGPQAERFFQEMRARTFFLGATGLAFPEGVTDPSPFEIQVKRAMAASAKRTILLLDSSKFGMRSLLPIIPLGEISVLVTDENAPVEYVTQLRDMGIDVHLATTEA